MDPLNVTKNVVVTGVSSGIGLGTAKVLLSHGLGVFGSVRKTADAERLKKELGDHFEPLLLDTTDVAAVQVAAARVKERLAGKPLFGLVNNAGIALGGPLLFQPLEEFRRQIEVNLIGVFNVTQSFAPLLAASEGAGRPGRIVNISSVGGKSAAPFLGAYSASKFALEGFSESLRRELMIYGIDVIVVGPGAVATPIWDKSEKADFSRYRGTPYGKSIDHSVPILTKRGRETGLPPERVGAVIYRALTIKRPKVRYAVVPNPMVDIVLPALLPKRVIDKVFARMMGLTSAKSVR